MLKIAGVPLLLAVATPMLSGCGDSHPLPQSSLASGAVSASTMPSSSPAPASALSSAASAARAYLPATGAFVPEASAAPVGSAAPRVVDDCNVDSVNGNAVDGASLARASAAEFAGWAADSATDTVPKHVRFVLKNARDGKDFVVEVATGETRTDVAQARKMPALTASGWSMQADLSAVTPGRYDTVLFYRIDGKLAMCDPHHVVTIR